MFDIVYNPVAGKGKALKALAVVEAEFSARGITYRKHESTHAGGVKEATQQAIQKGARNILAMGGDGTLHEVINGFSNFENVGLGIIPCGTGNDFASSLGISERVEEALTHVIEGTLTYVDYLQLPYCRGINVASYGIDVDVLRRYAKKKNKTKGAYMASLISSILHYKKPYTFTAEINGEREQHAGFIAAAGNGKRFGGSIYICPEANPYDGLLDIVTVDNVRKLGIPAAFIKLMKKKILNYKKTKFTRAEALRVTTGEPMVVNVDGELYDADEFAVKVVHNALRVWLKKPAEANA